MVTAREVMSDTAFADADDTVDTAAALMRDHGLDRLPVCARGRGLAGVLTQRDIVTRCVAAGADPRTSQVCEYSVPAHPTIAADEPIERALVAMAVEDVRSVLVVEGEALVGVVFEADVVTAAPTVALATLMRGDTHYRRAG